MITFYRWLVVCAVPLVAGLSVAMPARAHEGHDDAAPLAAVSASPRAEAHSDAFEVVVTLATSHRLIIWLDRQATNAPVTGATMTVSDGAGAELAAQPQADGSYTAEPPWAAVPGKHDLSLTVTAGSTADLLATVLTVPDQAALPRALPGTANPAGGWLTRMWATMLGAAGWLLVFVSGVAAGLIWRRVVGRATKVAVLLAIGAAALAPPAAAHNGADDGDAPAGQLTSDAPHRLADGSVFLPKPAQHLLAIRTIGAVVQPAARSVQLMGEIAADPNAAGQVQASGPGRVTFAPGGPGGPGRLATLGQQVRAGDVLAEIEPVLGGVERSTTGAQAAEIAQSLRVAEQRAARLATLAGSVAGKDIDEAREDVRGLRRRQAAITAGLSLPEILRAPVSGIVSTARAVSGQVVDRSDVLFEIIDPQRLWVLAGAFDAAVAGHIIGGAAVTEDGQALTLSFVGAGRSLREGAVPLAFRINTPPPGLNVGMPVKLYATLTATQSGIALPRTALVRLPNGQDAVWEHPSAERFVARPVRVATLDGAQVLVVAGLAPGARVVISGADLLGQVR